MVVYYVSNLAALDRGENISKWKNRFKMDSILKWKFILECTHFRIEIHSEMKFIFRIEIHSEMNFILK